MSQQETYPDRIQAVQHVVLGIAVVEGLVTNFVENVICHEVKYT